MNTTLSRRDRLASALYLALILGMVLTVALAAAATTVTALERGFTPIEGTARGPAGH